MDSAWKKRDLFSGRLDGVVMLSTLFPSVAGLRLSISSELVPNGVNPSLASFLVPWPNGLWFLSIYLARFLSFRLLSQLSKRFQWLDVKQKCFVKGIYFIWVGVCHGGELKNVIDIGVDNFARFSIFYFDYVFCFFISLSIKWQSIDVYPGFRLQ